MNKLLGTIPDAVSHMVEARSMWLRSNKLQGSLPRTLICNQILGVLSVSSNELSGTIGMIESPRFYTLDISENKS